MKPQHCTVVVIILFSLTAAGAACEGSNQLKIFQLQLASYAFNGSFKNPGCPDPIYFNGQSGGCITSAQARSSPCVVALSVIDLQQAAEYFQNLPVLARAEYHEEINMLFGVPIGLDPGPTGVCQDFVTNQQKPIGVFQRRQWFSQDDCDEYPNMEQYCPTTPPSFTVVGPNYCNHGANSGNRCVTRTTTGEPGCDCADDYTGAACQFKKTDHCCNNGKCPYRSTNVRDRGEGNKRIWCGGHDVDCSSSDMTTLPVCLCPPGYSGPHCTSSDCDAIDLYSDVQKSQLITEEEILASGSCNEFNSNVQMHTGKCERSGNITHCSCVTSFYPFFYLPETGCRVNIGPNSVHHDSSIIQRCGLRKDPRTSNTWVPECNGAGTCTVNGCVCDDPELDPELSCQQSRCRHCIKGHSTCTEADGVCVCGELWDGTHCGRNRCTETGGQMDGADQCICPPFTKWHTRTASRNSGCVYDTPKKFINDQVVVCGHKAAAPTGVLPFADVSEAKRLRIYRSICQCHQVAHVSPDDPHVVDNDVTSDSFGSCISYCAEDHEWRNSAGSCCWKYDKLLCVHKS